MNAYVQTLLGILLSAVLTENFILVKFYGICPFMGVSKKIDTALGMGMAVTFVMALASAACWLVNEFLLVPLELAYMQTVAFILVIASIVQVVEMFLKKMVPALYKALGVFIPLIVVNCMVLGRAEAFASRNGVLASAWDGLCQGVGYTVALVVVCVIRELLGSGTFGGGLLGPGGAGIQIIPQPFPAMQLVMPVGGFLVLGFVLAGSTKLMNYLEKRNKKKEAAK